METARCICPVDSQGTKCGRNSACAIHGFTSPVPLVPWLLNANDKKMLASFRISALSAEEIEAVREEEERRFNRNV